MGGKGGKALETEDIMIDVVRAAIVQSEMP